MFGCDVAFAGRHNVIAVTGTGEPVAGRAHDSGQGFACAVHATSEEEGSEAPAGALSDWMCTGGAVAAGANAEGFFTAQRDPCAAALTLRVTIFEEIRRRPRPLVKIALPIDCSASHGGGGGGAGQGAPVLSAFRISPSTFKAAGRGGSIATATGATVSYKLSAAAKSTFAVERALPGVRIGGRCAAPGRATAGKPRCTRFARAGSFTHAGRTGSNRFRFTGRLAGRKLTPGAYRFTVTARSGTGPISSAVRSAQFHIAR